MQITRAIRSKRRLALTIGLAIALAGAGGAAGASLLATSSSSPSSPIAYVPTTTGATSSPLPGSSAVRQALSAIGASDIVSAQVGSPPSDVPSQNASSAIPALYVTVKIPGLGPGEALESLWEADLLEGSIVRLAGSSASVENDIGYVSYDGQLPDGTTVPDMGGGIGDVASGQQFVSAGESDAAVQISIDQTVATYGLTLDSLTIFHAPSPAPAVVVTAPDIAKVAANYQSLVNDLFGSTPRYVGYYLEIRGPDSKTYVRSSTSFLTGSGRLWLDPSVDGTGQLPVHG
jgi:hypothetical protein